MEGVKWMEEVNGKKFGDLKNPLLVSVRSGARASMPGMMDTARQLGNQENPGQRSVHHPGHNARHTQQSEILL